MKRVKGISVLESNFSEGMKVEMRFAVLDNKETGLVQIIILAIVVR